VADEKFTLEFTAQEWLVIVNAMAAARQAAQAQAIVEAAQALGVETGAVEFTPEAAAEAMARRTVEQNRITGLPIVVHARLVDELADRGLIDGSYQAEWGYLSLVERLMSTRGSPFNNTPEP
jgi:hypothetical protein